MRILDKFLHFLTKQPVAMAATGVMAATAITSTGGNEKDEKDNDDDALFSALAKSLADVNSNMAKVQKRMCERADECNEASKRRRCSDLEDTGQMSLEYSRFSARAKELGMRSCSMKYEMMLVRLILNDKDIRIVNSDFFFHGHDRGLGGALLYNTTVTDLNLDLDYSLLSDPESEASKEMKLLLMFLDKNKSLVRFGAKPTRFLERNDTEYPKISSMLLNGLLKCQQLERLTWALPLSAAAFYRVMTTLESLRELDLGIKDAHDYSHVEKRAISYAFQSNNTLQKLTLRVDDDVDLFSAILGALPEHSTLQDLHLHAPDDECDGYFDALFQYLRSSRALRRLEMERFFIDESHMTKIVQGLQRPGETASGIPIVTLSSLHFTRCHINDDSCDRLAAFLQTETTNSVSVPILESHLRTFHVSSDPEFDLDLEHTERTNSRMVATSLLMAPSDASDTADDLHAPPIFITTIGSQIRCVSLEGVTRRFFHILQTHARQVGHLHTLELVRLSRGAAMAFSKCLSKLVSLRTLKINPWASDGGWDLNLIVDGLKQNGGVLDVDTYNSNGRSEFNSAQLRLIQAYGQRNRHLNALLASDQGLVNADDSHDKDNSAIVDGACEPGMDTVDVQNEENESSNGNSSNNSNASSDPTASNANLLVRPSLLQCTGQVPHTHTAMMIRGLSVLGQDIVY